jgi:RNA polymerase sigma-70 factor, ECF subfamily
VAVFAGVDDEAVLAVYLDDSRRSAEREQAFHALVERYQRRLFAVCVRMLGSASDAEDAVQEVFVRLARSGGSFRGDARLSTWLYRVARNVCTDQIRFQARRPSTPVDDLTAVGEHPVVDDLVGAHDTAEQLREALAQLDDRSRLLLLLIGVEELSYQEAAEVTGLAVGTVKSRVSRARVQLGELLAARVAPDGGTPAGPPTSHRRPPPTADPPGPARAPPG